MDLHADTPLHLVEKGGYSLRQRLSFNQVDVPRLRQGNVAGQFFVLYPPPRPTLAGRAEDFCRRALEAIRRAAVESGEIEMVATSAELRAARARGKIGGFLGIEGSECLSGKVEALSRWRALGVRYLGLTWNYLDNPFATAATDTRNRARGLTEAGRTLVAEANRLGVLIDLSHASEQTFWDVYEVTRGPLIASHSSSASLCRHPRNLDDEQARAIARTGGVIGVNFHRPFVKARGPVTVDDVAAHVLHLVRVAGPDAVALGSDFDGLITVPDGLEDVSRLPNLTAALLRAGLAPADVRKVLGENVLRVLDDASRDLHRGPRLVPLRARRVRPRGAARLFDRNDLTRWRLRQTARFVARGKPTHLAMVPCAPGRVRLRLSRAGRVAWSGALDLGAERAQIALPDLPAGTYVVRLSGRACLREVTIYGPDANACSRRCATAGARSSPKRRTSPARSVPSGPDTSAGR